MKISVFLLALLFVGTAVGQTGNGQTTRYWDCCKPSCAWPGKAPVTRPATTCAANGETIRGVNDQSGCNNGPAYACNNHQPWAVNNNLAYGFVAAFITGSSEYNWCCACYELTFTSGPVQGKRMIVQITNTGGDLGNNHFDIQMPGGGVGLFNGCKPQWGAPDAGWGERYGGVRTRQECDQLPSQIRAGCQWRFDWFMNADNPSVNFQRLGNCPAEITQKSQCSRTQN